MEKENPEIIRNTLMLLREKLLRDELKVKDSVKCIEAERDRFYMWNVDDEWTHIFYLDNEGRVIFVHLYKNDKPKDKLWVWWLPNSRVDDEDPSMVYNTAWVGCEKIHIKQIIETISPDDWIPI